MPDLDPKIIPVLEDIIDDDSGETVTAQEIEAEELPAENNLDLFAAEPASLADEPPIIMTADQLADEDEDKNEIIPEENTSAADTTAAHLFAGAPHITGAASVIPDEPLSSFSAIDDALADVASEDHEVIIDLDDAQDSTDIELIAEDDVIFTADPGSDEERYASAWQQEEDEDEFIESALIDYQHPGTPTLKNTDEDHAGCDNLIEPCAEADNLDSEPGFLSDDPHPQTRLASVQEHEQKPEQYGQSIDIQPMIDNIIRQLMPDLEQQIRLLVRQALRDNLPDSIIDNKKQQQDPQ